MLSKDKEKMNEKYERVLITCVFDTIAKGLSKIPVYTEEEYMKQLKIKDKKQGGLCELVGLKEYQVKPYFDLDPKGDFDYTRFDEFEADLKRRFLDLVGKEPIINISGREPRIEYDKLKHSRRFYLEARISYFNIPVIFKEIFEKYNDIIDKGIYDTNRRYYTPLSTRKRDLVVPELKVIKGNIFGCCATYIKEEYEDLDLKINIIKEEPKSISIDKDEDEDDNPNKYNRLCELIKLLSSKRSDIYDSWINIIWCLINICNKEKIPRRKCYELIHLFSKLSETKYYEDKVDDWLDKNYDKVRDTGFSWNYLLHTCIKEDNPKYYETITKSYYNMKREFEINNAKILYPPMVVHIDRNCENIIQPIPLCEKTNRHIKCSIKEINKKGEIIYKDKKFIELWLDDPKIRKYDNYVFKPYPLKVEEYEFNTWTNFHITKIKYEKDDSIINRFLDYMENLFNNDEVMNYIIAYFANRIQNPANRNMVCLILYGEEGDGKNRLFDIFKNIFGNKYYTELEKAKDLFGTHSCIEKEKLFICVNEAKGKDNYENSETLKARITTDKLLVNPKGIQEFTIDNYCDYIMTTNNANAVNLHDKSRRYLYVETTSYYSRNSEFFNTFSEDIVDNPKALRVIYEYLMNFNIKNIIPSGNFQNHIPETEIQKEIIKNNRDKILYFLEYFINESSFAFKDEIEIKIKNSILFDNWILWINKNNIKSDYNNIAFHTRLAILTKKRINVSDNIIRKDTNHNTYINKEKLRKFFIKLNN